MQMKSIITAMMVLAGIVMAFCGYLNASSVPIVREQVITMPGWPADERPRKVLLISDLHIAIPGSSPDRLTSIVDQINAQHPDIILLAGDFVSTKQLAWSRPAFAAAVAPLRRLRAPLGVYAVLGNHDHWMDADEGRRALAAIGIQVLDNQAVQAGPIALGGVDDAFTWNANVPGTAAQIRRLTGSRVLLSHSPDVTPDTPADIPLILAGHTHCGQISLPIIGPLVTMSKYGKRYACGVVREGARTTIIGSGTGTSLLPIRFGAPPDMWLITLKGTKS